MSVLDVAFVWALFLGVLLAIVQGMSPRGRQIGALIIAAMAGSATTAAIAYRHSTDGPTRNLWLQILIYGVWALIALRILEKAVRNIGGKIRLVHARRSGT